MTSLIVGARVCLYPSEIPLCTRIGSGLAAVKATPVQAPHLTPAPRSPRPRDENSFSGSARGPPVVLSGAMKTPLVRDTNNGVGGMEHPTDPHSERTESCQPSLTPPPRSPLFWRSSSPCGTAPPPAANPSGQPNNAPADGSLPAARHAPKSNPSLTLSPALRLSQAQRRRGSSLGGCWFSARAVPNRVDDRICAHGSG